MVWAHDPSAASPPPVDGMTGLSGTVVHGQGRGTGLGFPTANIDCPTHQLPADGIYAGVVHVEHDPVLRSAVMSVGSNPTFGNHLSRRLEVHLIDFDGDLYGQRLVVDLLLRMRPMERYDGAEVMVQQALADLERCRALFAALNAQSYDGVPVRDLECW
ncbi:riboflavin kinase [Demequina sp. B12]|uniref:riboflavin kinase n=1 Tax=Demequina sp. B12 TaxID=2992757 RepID=UPI00237BA845|nr:riboflavin kinase [Demequina sp. B12]MDE0573688.1 riboflavin kinase [Demequina sp. B12]